MTLTLAQKALLLLAVPFALLLVLLGLVAGVERDTADPQHRELHTREVVGQARQVMAHLVDAQSGVRGYVVTGDPAFLAPYDSAVTRLPTELDELTALVADNPTQVARVAALREQTTAFIGWQAGTVERVRAGDAAGAAARVRRGDGDRQSAALRAEFAALLAEEDRLDAGRADVVKDARRRLWLVLAGGGAVATLVTAALAIAFHRGVSRRVDVLVETTRRLAAGAPPAAPLVGRDEFARVDAAVRVMAAELGHTAGLLRAAAAEVHDLYDHAPCGYHSVGPDGVLLAMNATELRWLGYAAGEAVGWLRFADVVAPASRAAYLSGFATVRDEGGVTDVEIDLVRRDGTTFPVLVNSSAVRAPDGRFLRSRTTLTDLTARRRAEDETRRLNAELEERVRARTADLADANRELAHKNGENEMFVYSVSHDLRGPLVNLQGFAAELDKGCRRLSALVADPGVPPAVRDGAEALLGGKMDKALGFIRAAVLRLSGIIEALLRLSRAGRVEYRWEAVDVAAVVARVESSLHGTVTSRGAAVVVGDLPPAWGDPTAVEQVFANLVGNALTYLDPARPGRVEVGCLPGTADGQRVYYVRDNGLGIAEAHRGKIFQAFQRAHPQVAGGEGIGLAIVARVAERHRGRAWVESEAGTGSTFFVALPAAPAGGG